MFEGLAVLVIVGTLIVFYGFQSWMDGKDRQARLARNGLPDFSVSIGVREAFGHPADLEELLLLEFEKYGARRDWRNPTLNLGVNLSLQREESGGQSYCTLYGEMQLRISTTGPLMKIAVPSCAQTVLGEPDADIEVELVEKFVAGAIAQFRAALAQ